MQYCNDHDHAHLTCTPMMRSSIPLVGRHRRARSLGGSAARPPADVVEVPTLTLAMASAGCSLEDVAQQRHQDEHSNGAHAEHDISTLHIYDSHLNTMHRVMPSLSQLEEGTGRQTSFNARTEVQQQDSKAQHSAHEDKSTQSPHFLSVPWRRTSLGNKMNGSPEMAAATNTPAFGMDGCCNTNLNAGIMASDQRSLRHMPSQAFSASSAQPLGFHDLSAIYSVVADRRNSYDNLLWQCPTLALTAQSFLFSTALDGETRQVARIITMLLSIVITMCSLQLFTKQLAAEQADRQWLSSFEKRHGVPYEDTAFGENWTKYKKVLPADAGFVKALALTGSFPLWLALNAVLSPFSHRAGLISPLVFWARRNSLFVFLGAAISVLVISFAKPELFEGGDSRRAA